MPLTTAQETTVVNYLRASQDQGVIDALAIGNVTFLVGHLNGQSTVDVWKPDVSPNDLFEAMQITKFDNLTAGKRDAYRLMLQFAPLDFAKNQNRKAVSDIWGADSAALLAQLVRKASVIESLLVGNSATTDTVTAFKLNYQGPTNITEIGEALRNNP